MVATALIQPTTENTVSGYAIFTVDPVSLLFHLTFPNFFLTLFF